METDLGKVKEQTGGKYANMEIRLKKKYNAISKNGDTLEISEAGKSLGVHTEMGELPPCFATRADTRGGTKFEKI